MVKILDTEATPSLKPASLGLRVCGSRHQRFSGQGHRGGRQGTRRRHRRLLTAKLTAKPVDKRRSRRTPVDTTTSLTRLYGLPWTRADGIPRLCKQGVVGSIPISSTEIPMISDARGGFGGLVGSQSRGHRGRRRAIWADLSSYESTQGVPLIGFVRERVAHRPRIVITERAWWCEWRTTSPVTSRAASPPGERYGRIGRTTVSERDEARRRATAVGPCLWPPKPVEGFLFDSS